MLELVLLESVEVTQIDLRRLRDLSEADLAQFALALERLAEGRHTGPPLGRTREEDRHPKRDSRYRRKRLSTVAVRPGRWACCELPGRGDLHEAWSLAVPSETGQIALRESLHGAKGGASRRGGVEREGEAHRASPAPGRVL